MTRDEFDDRGFLGIEHRPFNYPLRDARVARGWTRRRLAAEAGVPESALGQYEALKKWPTRMAAEKIATILGDSVEHLFPDEAGLALEGHSARTVVSVLPIECLSIDTPEVLALMAGSAGEEDREHDDLRGRIAGVLDTLTPREQLVLRRRFGLEDGDTRTLKEMGKEFNVTASRVRQIEAKALRKLRHPSRSHKITDYLAPEPICQDQTHWFHTERRTGGERRIVDVGFERRTVAVSHRRPHPRERSRRYRDPHAPTVGTDDRCGSCHGPIIHIARVHPSLDSAPLLQAWRKS